jgi:hypothetical protein
VAFGEADPDSPRKGGAQARKGLLDNFSAVLESAATWAVAAVHRASLSEGVEGSGDVSTARISAHGPKDGRRVRAEAAVRDEVTRALARRGFEDADATVESEFVDDDGAPRVVYKVSARLPGPGLRARWTRAAKLCAIGALLLCSVVFLAAVSSATLRVRAA